MILSHRSTSTIVCNLNNESYKIDTPELFTKLLLQSINMSGENDSWMLPSQRLISIINKLPNDSMFSKKLTQGYGDLFRIIKNDNSKIKSVSSEFGWSSVKIENMTAGSYYSLRGGQIHAGSGATAEEVRILLFWTFNLKKDESYNINEQETKLSMIFTLAECIWDSLCLSDKVEMLILIWHVFETCQKSYKNTCHTTMLGYANLPTLIRTMSRWPVTKSEKRRTTILTYMKLIAARRNFFKLADTLNK